MKRNRNDIVAEIKTARAQAQARVNDYEKATTKRYDHWRVLAADATKRYDRWRSLAEVIAYHGALALFEQEAEHEIPDMAAAAVANLERLHRRGLPVPTMNLAVAHGRRDALVSVAEWMTDEGETA